MIFGNLSDVLEGDKTITEAVQHNFDQSYNNIKKPSQISKILKTLSHYGMNYSDKVYQNMIAIPADKALQPKDPLVQQSLYGTGFLNNWKIKPEEEKNFTEKTLDQRREILRKLAMQPELEDILDIKQVQVKGNMLFSETEGSFKDHYEFKEKLQSNNSLTILTKVVNKFSGCVRLMKTIKKALIDYVDLICKN